MVRGLTTRKLYKTSHALIDVPAYCLQNEIDADLLWQKCAHNATYIAYS